MMNFDENIGAFIIVCIPVSVIVGGILANILIGLMAEGEDTTYGN